MPIEPNDIPTFVDNTTAFLITCPQATTLTWTGSTARKTGPNAWRLTGDFIPYPDNDFTDLDVATLIAEAGGMYTMGAPDPEPEEEKYHLEFHIDITPVEDSVGDYGFSFYLKGDDAFTVRDGLGFLQASIGRFRRLMEENDLMGARLSNDDDDAVGIPVNNQ